MCSNKSEINLGHLDCLQFMNMLWNNTSCSTMKDLFNFYLAVLFTQKSNSETTLIVVSLLCYLFILFTRLYLTSLGTQRCPG